MGVHLSQGILSGGENPDQFRPDLVEPAAVRFALLVKHTRQFGCHLQVRLGLLLDLEVDHFFQ